MILKHETANRTLTVLVACVVEGGLVLLIIFLLHFIFHFSFL